MPPTLVAQRQLQGISRDLTNIQTPCESALTRVEQMAKSMEEEEFDTTATHQGLGGNDDDMDEDTASLQSESGSSMDDDSI